MNEKPKNTASEEAQSIKGFSKDARLLDAFIQKLEDIEKQIKGSKQPSNNTEILDAIKLLEQTAVKLLMNINRHVLTIQSDKVQLDKQFQKVNEAIINNNNKELLNKLYKELTEIKNQQQTIVQKMAIPEKSLADEIFDNLYRNIVLYIMILICAGLIFWHINKLESIDYYRSRYEELLEKQNSIINQKPEVIKSKLKR